WILLALTPALAAVIILVIEAAAVPAIAAVHAVGFLLYFVLTMVAGFVFGVLRASVFGMAPGQASSFRENASSLDSSDSFSSPSSSSSESSFSGGGGSGGGGGASDSW